MIANSPIPAILAILAIVKSPILFLAPPKRGRYIAFCEPGSGRRMSGIASKKSHGEQTRESRAALVGRHAARPALVGAGDRAGGWLDIVAVDSLEEDEAR